LGLESLAVIRGIACTQERRDPSSEVGLLGEGLTEAVMEATKDLQLPRETVSDLYGDINGERGRTEDWGFTLMRTGPRFRDGTEYVSTVGQCGDVGAATATFGCVLASEAWRVNRAHGRLALVWAGSWAGLRGAVVLEKATT
jgi:3-oxoacyl-[acyl-carrier-protein] synthase-1